MFFEKTEKYNLKQYFDSNCPDVRVRLRELFKRTKDTIAKEKEINLEVVLLIGCLEAKNAAVNLLAGKREDLARRLGLTPNMYWKRAQAGRVLLNHPEFIDLIVEGKTHVSHVAILAPKLTQANKQIFIERIIGKSERETRELAASVNRDGTINEIEPTMDIKLSLTNKQIRLLERSREVLSATGKVPSDEEVITKALEDLLAKRDPMQKAERARVRERKKLATLSAVDEKGQFQETVPFPTPSAKKGNEQKLHSEKFTICRHPSLKKKAHQVPADDNSSSLPKGREYISAHIRHRVYLRDGGRCTHIDKDGRRCSQTSTLQIDHLVPVALGGSNELENLRLLCREHNVSEGERLLGEHTIVVYRGQSPK